MGGHEERTGDARISGTAAALCGVHSASTPDELALAECRLVLLTAVTHGFGGLPLLYPDDTRVLAWHRRHPRSGHFIGLANFSEQPASVELGALLGLGPTDAVLSSDSGLAVRDGRLVVAGLGFAWLAQE